MGGKSSSGAKQQVTQYFASIHFGICHGPIDHISQIIINEKEAWSGTQEAQGTIEISEKQLFGGNKKEGGVEGYVEYLPGGPTQTIPENLAAKAGLTTATMPAYRGMASAWFYEGEFEFGNDSGFYWTANSPYLPGVWIKAARASTALNDVHARIWRGGERDTRTLADSDTSSTNAWRLLDISGSLLAHASVDLSQIIVEDVRTGEVQAEIDIAYDPMWVVISPSLVHVLVLGGDGVLYDYSSTDGTLIDTLALGVDPTPTGAEGGELNGTPTEIVVDGVTYLFFMVQFRLLCCSNDGSGWAHRWTDFDWGFFNVGGVIAAGPTYLAIRFSSGVVSRVPWTAGAMGASNTVDFSGLLGWDVTSTEVINSLSYIPDSDTWFFTTFPGPIATLNSGLSAVVASGDTGVSTGGTNRQPIKSRRVQKGTDTAAFVYTDVVHYFDISTCQEIEEIPLSEWSLSGDVIDAGYSEEENAFVVRFETSDVVIFLPHGEFDSNPSHIIYDCLTNTDWGMGAPASAIDFNSFTDAAVTLYAEDFGLSMIWTQQATIEFFISEVLDHIEATLFVSPLTGLLTLKLIRDDYDVETLTEFTPDNSVVTNWQRKLWGETVNEIVVSWTNPENEETETVVAQDLANIEAQGGIVSDGRNYYGVRVKDLAMRLAQRDLRAAATPLASCEIEVNREAWNLLPGDVVILNSPEDDIVSIVMRVGPVDYGKPGQPTVKASLVEDVWALPLAEYTVPPDTLAEETSEEPTAADNTLIVTLPYFVTVNTIDAGTLAGMDYPEVFAGVLASEEGTDGDDFDLYGEVTDGGGNTTFEDIGTKSITSRGTLPDAIDAEVETVIVSFPDRTQGHGPTVGGFMLIEGDGEDEHELCLVTAFDGSPTAYTFQRGALDTVPLDWPAGTPVWFFDPTTVFADSTIRSAAETVDYKVLIRTSLGLLDEASAPIASETLTARPHLPLRPAGVTVNGDDGFSGAVNLVGVNPIPTAWARRNRLTEDAIVLAWDAADVTPEAGQTTTVRLTDLAGNTLHEYTGISGTSQNVDPADFGAEPEGYIEFWSVRDALESLQAFRVRVIVAGDPFEFEDGESYEFEDDEPKFFED